MFLVDDQPFAREGLRAMLEALANVLVVGASSDPASAVDAIKESRANFVLIDVGASDRHGFQVTQRIKHEVPGTKIVVIANSDDPDVVVDAFRSGAVGSIARSVGPAELADMLRSVATDGIYLRSPDATLLLEAMKSEQRAPHRITLTPREAEVLRLLAGGSTARAVSDHLGIGERTVHTYISSMYRKLGVTNKVGALREAIKLGLLTVEA